MKPQKNTRKQSSDSNDNNPLITTSQSESTPERDWVDDLKQNSKSAQDSVHIVRPRGLKTRIPVQVTVENILFDIKSKHHKRLRTNKQSPHKNKRLLKRSSDQSKTESSPSIVKQSGFLDAMLARMPKDTGYNVFAKRLEEEAHRFKQEVAANLLPALKDEMLRTPSATYEQKIELVRLVNAELRRFDLAIKSPKTGQPSTFKARPGNHPEIGSFQLISEDAEGKERTFTTPLLSTLLDTIELMEAAPRREALTEWHEKVSRKFGGPKRS